MRIASIVGARPQFIKAAVVSNLLRSHPDVEEVLIHTGQHYSPTLSEIFFQELDIPQADLNLEVGPGLPSVQIGQMLIKLDAALRSQAFDWVLVYGDTSTTLAGALAAVKLGIPLAHVEAGLRSYDRKMPEEMNRLTTDHLADLLFTPTTTASQNLEHEGIPSSRIHFVGDVMYDSVLQTAEHARRHSRVLERLNLEPGGYLLCTVHRAENTDVRPNLAAILDGLSQVAFEIPVILPLHPRTQAAMEREGLQAQAAGLRLIEPLGYLDMLHLEANARLIATDSGGVQKEAFFTGVPCVILRPTTEWVELVENGWSTLAPPTSAPELASALRAALAAARPARGGVPLFGDGHAAEKICTKLLQA